MVTFFATLALLSLIGSAIGFGVVEPTSNDPLAGVGTGVLIWTVITMILAFLAGGFVAGVASRRVGVLHGFLTWATSHNHVGFYRYAAHDLMRLSSAEA